MTSPAYRIVVALDLLEYSEIVLEHALDQAASRTSSELHLVTVVDGSADLEATKRTLAALVLPALEGLPTSDWSAQLHVRRGEAPEEVTDLAAEVRAHLLVIGRFGLHHPRRKISETAGRVIERATCPTLVVTLDDHSPDAVVQCPACVEVREQSEGERWFCAAHAGDRIRLSSMITRGTTTTSGLMW